MLREIALELLSGIERFLQGGVGAGGIVIARGLTVAGTALSDRVP